MSLPDFIPKQAVSETENPQEISSTIKAVAEIFSDRSEKIEAFIWKTLDETDNIHPRFYNNPERVGFVSEYYGEKYSEEANSRFATYEDSKLAFELLKKYPSIVSELIKTNADKREFRKLSDTEQMNALYLGYREHCLESASSCEAIYDGESCQYQVMQNIHGDVTLRSIPYKTDVQSDMFPELKPAVIELDNESSTGIHMYQETIVLLIGLCMIYKRMGGQKEAFAKFNDSLSQIDSRTPNAADVGRDDSNVHFALNFLHEQPIAHDTTGRYEYTSLCISSWPGSENRPTMAIRDTNTLVILKKDENGEIRFGESAPYSPVFEIPAEDMFGVLELLHRFPGRSGATNRTILEEFTKSL